MFTEKLEIVFTSKILGPLEIGGPKLKPFHPNGKSAPVPTLIKFLATRLVALLVSTKRSCGLLLIRSMWLLLVAVHFTYCN